MTKKVSGIDNISNIDQISKLEELDKIEQLREVTGISATRSVSRVSGQSRIEGLGPRITESNQAEVLARIDTEAQKMFEGKRIPRQRQKTITKAIRMAVMAATVKDESDE